MNEPSISDVLTTLHTFREAVMVRFDSVERTLEQHGVALAEHSVALVELSTVANEHSDRLHHLSGSVARIERRQRGETSTLDDHERRITVLERRASPSPHA